MNYNNKLFRASDSLLMSDYARVINFRIIIIIIININIIIINKVGLCTLWVMKKPTIYFVNNFAKCWSIFKNFSPLDLARNSQ